MFSSFAGLLLIIVGFGVLIFVHELGHFLAAKWARIRTEAFAVGMGPVMVSWRKGVGFSAGSTDRKVRSRFGKPAGELSDAELAQHGVGETEYSLRWLPIGGFVKMLGQDDIRPGALSDNPRSYNVCSVGKRMIVVSAGVIMNVLLALVLFIAAFMVGVRFEAPIVGDVARTSPAARTMPDNARQLAITAPGLMPGDTVLSIDGKVARTFADIRIGAAMARPGESIGLRVRRAGFDEPLRFTITPEEGVEGGLLSIGVYPGASTSLLGGEAAPDVERYLRELGLAQAGVQPGMRLVSANGREVATHGELRQIVGASGGRPVRTIWTAVDERQAAVGSPIEAALPVRIVYQNMLQQSEAGRGVLVDRGLFGFSPLSKVRRVLDGSPNEGRLLPGDVLLRAGWVNFPRYSQLAAITAESAGDELELLVLRDDREVSVKAQVTRKGKLGVEIAVVESIPVSTEPAATVYKVNRQGDELEPKPTPAAPLNLLPGPRFEAVNATPIEDWPSLRGAMIAETAGAYERGEGATLKLQITHPTPGGERETVSLVLSRADVAELHELGWTTELDPGLFELIYTTRTAEGNPLRAVAMGFEETHKLIVMTYLTIDRLFRGSVGVDQLRGPIGIIDIGTKVLPRGFMYFLFLLGMISVNLAVLNFLPIPIVDGGLFLFLIYEKIRGRPPSPQFQNAAFFVGIVLIGALFVVTFYNDIARLLG